MTNILVVDDAVDSAEILAMVFKACGHESHVAHDGQAGLEATRRYLPHIVFLDLDMPVLDGYGAAQAIRAAPDTDHPFIVALTGQSGVEVQEKTKAAGFDLCLHKPADTNMLLALVDDLAERTRG